MAAVTCSMVSARPTAGVRPAARRSMTTVCAAAPRPAQKVEEPKKIVQIAAASLAALYLAAAPMAMADTAENVKKAVCASNPTSRICLKNSGLK
eukprot:jgi/Botrbrau1/9153/Bobra.160_3s0025.1